MTTAKQFASLPTVPPAIVPLLPVRRKGIPSCLPKLAARTTRLLTLAATLSVAAAEPANAQTFYETRTSFNAAATTATLYDFEGIAPDGGSVTDPAVLTTPAPGRVTFSVTGGGQSFVIAQDSDSGGGIYRLSDGSDSVIAGLPLLGDSSSTTRISLDNSYTAFGIEYGLGNAATSSYTFALFADDAPVGTPFVRTLIGGDNFFGATSATAFNNVRVTAAGSANVSEYVVFDNARTGSIAVVPEAGTLALLLPAFGVAVARRRFADR